MSDMSLYYKDINFNCSTESFKGVNKNPKCINFVIHHHFKSFRFKYKNYKNNNLDYKIIKVWCGR